MSRPSCEFRVIQISDTHLGQRRPFFHHNWELLVKLIAEEPHDLVICTGDMSTEGAEFEEELRFAARQFERIKSRVLFIPGNHDLGNSLPDVRGGENVMTAARREAYIRAFGPDFWTSDLGEHWRLIGLNSMLPGSGLPAEAEQQTMIADAVRTRDGRRLMVFQHKPLYIKTPDEERATQSALYPAHRFGLQQALAPAGRVIVCSGHIHDYKTTSWGNVDEIWAPSTAFVIDRDGLNNPVHGIRRVGYLVHTFTASDHSHAFVEPSRFITIDLGNWMRAPETFHGLYHTEPFRGLRLAEGV